MLDVRATDSDVEDERVVPIQQSEERFRELQPLKLAAIVGRHQSMEV
jgi:hypothetical protein